MSLTTLLLSGLITLFIVFFWYFNKKVTALQKEKSDKLLLEWLKTMQRSVDTSSNYMIQTLQENSRELNARLDKAAQVMRTVGVEVGQMNEIGRNMKELQEFLKSPKLRGNIGEHVLKDLIAQIFPKNSFHLQYTFRSGDKVDAAIKTDGGILPIDAKFPMESFQRLMKYETRDKEYNILQKEFVRDIKKHIDAIAKKYIVPDEGTMDFALMYVPSETVYYEIIATDDLLDYARQQRIYIVSPTTLYAHLQTILLSFEGKKIETQTKEVFQLLRTLQLDYKKVNESLELLGKHLGNASNQYMNVSKGFSQIGNKLDSTKQLKSNS